MTSAEDFDDEFVIGSDSESVEFTPDVPILPPSILPTNVSLARDVFPGFTIECTGYEHLMISVPSSILPLPLAVVNQFDRHPVLVNVKLAIHSNSFRAPATIHDISSPVLGLMFGGRSVVVDHITSFFTPRFEPKANYRCQVHVIKPVGSVSNAMLARVVSWGFPVAAARFF
jgi:hypothetical protein